jgi:hypothetical protein
VVVLLHLALAVLFDCELVQLLLVELTQLLDFLLVLGLQVVVALLLEVEQTAETADLALEGGSIQVV